MDFEHEIYADGFIPPSRSDAPSRLPAVYARLRIVTRWLQEVGISNDAIMLGFYNEAVRIAMKSNGVVGGCMLAEKLLWHVVSVLKNLHEKTQATTHFIPKPLPPRTPCAGEVIIEDIEELTVKCEAFPVDQKLWWVTGSLKETGIKPDDLMIGYFNSYLQVASETMDPMRVYTLTCQLHWHLAKLVRKLCEAAGAIPLAGLPTPPLPGKPPANDPPGDGGAAA
jgi:hypothetical protein